MDSDGGNCGLCSRCRSINIAAYFHDQEYPGTVELGPYQEIASRKHCTLCMLVIHAFSFSATEYWKSGKYPVEICYLGRMEGKSSPLVLDVWFDFTSQTLPERVWGHGTAKGRIMPLYPTSIPRDPPYDLESCGRLVGAQIDFNLVRTWLSNCKEHHNPQCISDHAASSDDFEMLLIDVERMRLVQARSYSRYVTLSYVWGRSKMFWTTKDNLATLQQDGAISSCRGELPRVVNDAIEFVRGLGETFLWVDALCIVQDDNKSKDEYIPRMGRIYGQALFTIVALAGPDADTGLPGVAPGSRKPSQRVVNLGQLQLVAGLESLTRVRHESVWHSRAWTFQEGVLSRRKLYISEHQIYWQCDRVSCSEDRVQCREGKTTVLRGIDNDLRSQFRVYASLVLQYAPRDTTYHSDSLNAFAGILSEITSNFGWRFASALPDHMFPLALLWKPQVNIKRRSVASSVDEVQPTACVSPSWCWSAWSGYINWDWWRQWSYACKAISLETEVETFVIKDRGNIRMITCAKGSDFISSTSEVQADSHWAANCIIGADFPRATLFFETNTLGLDEYSLLTPQPTLDGEPERLPGFTRNVLSYGLWIHDSAGRHCGTLYGLSESWTGKHDISQCEFVLLARNDQDKVTDADIEAHKDQLPLEHPSCKQYYEEIFDTSSYGYRRWWALNIMLIEWKEAFAERVAVGQMHADAWDVARQKLKRIVLA